MRFSLAVFALLSTFVLDAAGLPAFDRRINFLQDVLIFDAPAFQNPANQDETLVSLQSFAFLPQIDLSGASSVIEKALSAVGVDVGDSIDTALERIKLLAAVGLSGVDVDLDVEGCSSPAQLSGTSGLPDLGLALQNVSLGQCQATGKLGGQLTTSGISPRNFTDSIFFSPPDGFGVISDIDDTIKVSNVLDKAKLLKATLIDDPTPVTGMPELYASLAKSLNSPQFLYVSGSPFQLFPFLRGFVNTTFQASQGPIFLRNVTLNINNIVQLTQSDGVLNYKLSQIDRIHGMYPAKKFLTVGDSTEKDPETYGETFRKYGADFVACIWIRKVDGANNTDARFAAAFEDVPSNKIRLYTDDEIPSLQDINIPNGEC